VPEPILEGPAGALAGITDPAEGEAVAAAVLLHPHPLHGGSKEDAVLLAAAAPLRAASHDCTRFDFRGVGASEGTHDDVRGATDDAVAVCEAVRGPAPDRPLVLLGYSFGSAVAWHAAATVRPARLILIAPPVGLMDFGGDAPDGTVVDVIVGDGDDFAPLAEVRAWAEAREARLHVVEGGDHFLAADARRLADAVTSAITP
jgi:alpha/beta superfamily hydrolase